MKIMKYIVPALLGGMLTLQSCEHFQEFFFSKSVQKSPLSENLPHPASLLSLLTQLPHFS